MVKKLQNLRIARVSTVPLFIMTQLQSQLQTLSDAGVEVTVITSEDGLPEVINALRECKFITVSIAREINLITDIKALIRLTKIFLKENFDIVHSTTPKAGFLCALAAKLAGTPIRLHTYTGQPWVNLVGPKKSMVKFCDKLINRFNTHCYADSNGQRDFLIQQKVVNLRKISVLGSGSIAGVNISRFTETNFSEIDKKQIRKSLGLSETAFVLLFIGRINRDKGIFELMQAVGRLKTTIEITLIIAGPFEQNVEQETRAYAQKYCPNRLIFTGFYPRPENLIAIAEVLCLPSYREGFGTVVIEAAAMGVPTVASRIYGLTDAVVDEVTGLLAEPKNTTQLVETLDRIITNNELRYRLGKNAKARALKEFDSTYCDNLLIDEYKRLVSEIKSSEQ